jgi:hypothetical protein
MCFCSGIEGTKIGMLRTFSAFRLSCVLLLDSMGTCNCINSNHQRRNPRSTTRASFTKPRIAWLTVAGTPRNATFPRLAYMEYKSVPTGRIRRPLDSRPSVVSCLSVPKTILLLVISPIATQGIPWSSSHQYLSVPVSGVPPVSILETQYLSLCTDQCLGANPSQ